MHQIRPVAHIRTEFSEKFGIPRQSGLVPTLRATIVMEPEYRNPDWIKGLEEYNYLWLIFDFSKAHRDSYPPLVNPPRLGGRIKKGVFATRSPFRPNSMGLSSVKLESIVETDNGYELIVAGADLLDGTPIYDIKPYLPYADCHTDAVGSFGEAHSKDSIKVIFPPELREQVPVDVAERMEQVLAQDPRAAFNKKSDYVYGMSFLEYDIRFQIEEETLTIIEIVNRTKDDYRRIK